MCSLQDCHPLWRCIVFRRKTPTERTKLAAESKLCFSCLNEGHSFRQCPQPKKCTKDGCSCSHNTLLHGSDRIFPQKNPSDAKNSQSKTTKVSQRQTGSESSGMPSVTDVKGLLQITEVEYWHRRRAPLKFLLYVTQLVVIHGSRED